DSGKQQLATHDDLLEKTTMAGATSGRAAWTVFYLCFHAASFGAGCPCPSGLAAVRHLAPRRCCAYSTALQESVTRRGDFPLTGDRDLRAHAFVSPGSARCKMALATGSKRNRGRREWHANTLP